MSRCAVLAVLWGLAALAGCGPAIEPVSPDPAAKLKAPSPAALRPVVQGQTRLACDLYAKLAAAEGQGAEWHNVFFSPVSIATTLSMAAAGARGQTLEQMNRVLGLPAENPHALVGGELAYLRDLPEVRLTLANALWVQRGTSLLAPYTSTLADDYGATLHPLDFAGDREKARATINHWVSTRTNRKINQLAALGGFYGTERLVLTNAAYFKADWEEPFVPQATRPGTFHVSKDRDVQVPMMHGEAQRGAQTGVYKAAALDYRGGAVEMVVLVPAEGKRLADVEKLLTPAGLEGVWKALEAKENEFHGASIQMPKFTTRGRIDLSRSLADLGMPDAFRPGTADFSGIDGTRSLFIARVGHEAMVNVDEKGTEAAAATEMPARGSAMRLRVEVDRPFVLLIAEKSTHALLFLGRVIDPTAK